MLKLYHHSFIAYIKKDCYFNFRGKKELTKNLIVKKTVKCMVKLAENLVKTQIAASAPSAFTRFSDS